MLNFRERLMTVLRGGKADRIPLTMYEFVHGRPFDTPAGKRLHAQGLIPIGTCRVFREHYRDVTIERSDSIHQGSKQTLTRIETPLGALSERATIDPSYGSRWVQEHLVKSVEDYRLMKFVFDHTEIEPAYDDYRAADRAMGDRGIVLAEIISMPLMWLFVEIMGAAAWSEGILLHTDEFDELLESLARCYKRQLEIAASSPAEVVWLGDNITGTVISPSIFQEYCKPIYDFDCAVLRQAGKISFAHFDGANRPLRDCIAGVALDVIEAFTPPPMENMTVAEARRAWPDKVLSLNVPSSLFHLPAEEIERHVRQYVEEGGDQGRFIVGCTEDFDVRLFEHAFSAIRRAMYGA
jgi:uroporphyrinogen-III decarboxylase